MYEVEFYKRDWEKDWWSPMKHKMGEGSLKRHINYWAILIVG